MLFLVKMIIQITFKCINENEVPRYILYKRIVIKKIYYTEMSDIYLHINNEKDACMVILRFFFNLDILPVLVLFYLFWV